MAQAQKGLLRTCEHPGGCGQPAVRRLYVDIGRSDEDFQLEYVFCPAHEKVARAAMKLTLLWNNLSSADVKEEVVEQPRH